MTFIWPAMLVCLVAIPIFVLGYFVLYWRRVARRAELSALSLSEAESPAGFRQHVPFAIFLAALTLLLTGFARPEMEIGQSRIEGTVIVAFDSSNSMAADDVAPTRMDAAKQAVLEFVEQRPSGVDVGLVSFTNGAVVTLAATDVSSDLEAAIARLKPQGSTSLGQGAFTALGAIVGGPIPVDPEDDLNLATIDIGYHSDAVVLIVSDGENRNTPDPMEVAALAANAGVKIFAVGFGTAEGTTIEVEGFTIATALDESVLQQMAEITGGSYFAAGDQADFEAVYDAIDLELAVSGEKTEVTALMAGAAIVLLLLGAALSMSWFGRLA